AHKMKVGCEFTRKYRVNRLVYIETLPDQFTAARRERQIKGWPRQRKRDLISAKNPEWEDLAANWFKPGIRVSLDHMNRLFLLAALFLAAVTTLRAQATPEVAAAQFST